MVCVLIPFQVTAYNVTPRSLDRATLSGMLAPKVIGTGSWTLKKQKTISFVFCALFLMSLTNQPTGLGIVSCLLDVAVLEVLG